MSAIVKTHLELEYWTSSPYTDEEGKWSQLNRWTDIRDASLEQEAKRQARHYSDIYKKVRLVKRTVTRVTAEEEVDFSE